MQSQGVTRDSMFLKRLRRGIIMNHEYVAALLIYTVGVSFVSILAVLKKRGIRLQTPIKMMKRCIICIVFWFSDYFG
jgi:hypothetical protein